MTNYNLKGKILLLILSVFSMIFALLSKIDLFLYHRYNLNDFINCYSINFKHPSFIEFLLLLLYILPYIILFIYFMFLYKRLDSVKFLPIFFLILGASSFFLNMFKIISFREYASLDLENILVIIHVILLFISAVFGFIKFKQMLFYLIAICFSFALNIYLFVCAIDSFIFNIENELYISIISSCMTVLANVFICIILFVFIIKNKAVKSKISEGKICDAI